MIVYFADRNTDILGYASTNFKKGFTIIEDKKTEDVETGVSSFECTIIYDDDSRYDIEEFTKAGNYVLRGQDENEGGDSRAQYTLVSSANFFTIVEVEHDIKEHSINIYCEDAGLDFNNDTVSPYQPSGYVTAAQCVAAAISGSDFLIKENTVEDTKLVSFTDTGTITERLNSIAETYDCEIYFTFEIKGLTVTRKFVNIVKKRGVETDTILTLGRDIDNIIVKSNINDIATALVVKGDNNITIQDFDDGTDFYASQGVLYSRKGYANWFRYGIDDGYIRKEYSYTTSDRDVLKQKAIEELKKRREPEVNYDIDIVDLPYDLEVGDRINIVDEYGELYISGRILQLDISSVDDSHTATIGDFLLKEGGIVSSVKNLAKKFSEMEDRSLYTWVLYSTSSSPISESQVSKSPENKTFMGTLENQDEDPTDLTVHQMFEKISGFKWIYTKGSDGLSTGFAGNQEMTQEEFEEKSVIGEEYDIPIGSSDLKEGDSCYSNVVTTDTNHTFTLGFSIVHKNPLFYTAVLESVSKISGDDGKSAYNAAIEGGLDPSITESEFNTDLGDVPEAKKTATDFITSEEEGELIKIFPKSEKDNPRNYLQIDSDSIDIYKDSAVIATFGQEMKITTEKNNEFTVNNSGITYSDSYGHKVFELGDILKSISLGPSLVWTDTFLQPRIRSDRPYTLSFSSYEDPLGIDTIFLGGKRYGDGDVVEFYSLASSLGIDVVETQRNVFVLSTETEYTFQLRTARADAVSGVGRSYVCLGGNWNDNDNSLFKPYVLVGNGTTENQSNAFKLDSNGYGYFAGDVFVNCNADSSGGYEVEAFARGESDNWTWKKYNDGTFEAQYKETFSVACTNSSGNGWYRSNEITLNFPSEIGIDSTTYINPSVNANRAYEFISMTATGVTGITYYVCHLGSYTANTQVFCEVKGTWS